jgi:hypothetical protein
MKLAFRNKFFGYSEKDVPVTLNIGTIEAVCKALEIEFWQIPERAKNTKSEFTIELIYQGYITACKDSYKKPKYDYAKAIFWYEMMSKEAEKEFTNKMTELFGEISKMSGKKKAQARSQK